jgi:hypothetical protein
MIFLAKAIKYHILEEFKVRSRHLEIEFLCYLKLLKKVKINRASTG